MNNYGMKKLHIHRMPYPPLKRGSGGNFSPFVPPSPGYAFTYPGEVPILSYAVKYDNNQGAVIKTELRRE